VTRGLHGVKRRLNFWEWPEATHGPVVGEERGAQQIGGEPCDSRLAGPLEARNEDEDRLTCAGDSRSGEPEFTKENLGQSAHLVEGQIVGGEPPHFGGLITVGSRDSLRDRGIEDRHNVCRLVAIWIGRAVLGTSQDAEDVAQRNRDTGLFSGLSDGTLMRTFIGFDGAADGGPLPRVDLANQEKSPRVISRQDRGRWEYEEVMTHLVPEVANMG